MTTEPTRDVASWRREYEDRGLSAEDLGPDPLAAFVSWLVAARTAGLHEPNAMVVSSSDASGAPSSRMVLLKTVDARGFVFYTNLESRKGAEILARPVCALLFPWHPLERQVRVEGVASLVDDIEADAYFASRPRGSQIGAWASPQSQVVPGRDDLQQRYARELDRFESVDVVPRPARWSGFLVRPHRIEFWQGRPGRMHDRIQFDRADDATWVVERLGP
ncbi:MAG: pyridoxamine 5'-phosphate oxidase [Nocardioidaceae bacterium]